MLADKRAYSQKCDATRPHCGTCVRSHKHHLRTSPNSTAGISCEYDDGVPGGEDKVYSVQELEEDDAEASKRKKRKATGETKRKSRKDDDEDETEKLRKKIGAHARAVFLVTN